MDLNGQDFFDYLRIERGIKESTIQHFYSSPFKRVLYFFQNRDFSYHNARDFIMGLESEGYSKHTIHQYTSLLRLLTRFLCLRGQIGTDFSLELKYPRIPKKLYNLPTTDEIERILAVGREYKQGNGGKANLKPTYDLIISLLAKCGCRVGEVLKLGVEDIDFGSGIIRLIETKTGDPRIIPIPQDIIDTLRGYVKKRKGYVFLSVRGKPLRSSDVGNELNARSKIAGIEKHINPHLLRHSFITEMLRANIGVATVSKIVGHTNPVHSLNTYQHLVVDDMKQALTHHPLIRKCADPNDVLKVIKQKVEDMKLGEDNRFNLALYQSKGKLKIEVDIV